MIQATAEDEPPLSSGGIASFFPSLELLRKGYRAYLLRNQEVKMEIKGKQHSLRVMKIYEDKVTIVVSSEPQTFNLTIDETKEIDVDGDNKVDLKVFLQEIVLNKANLIITSIEQTSDGEELQGTDVLEEPKEKSWDGVLNTIVILEGLLILLAIGLVIWFVIKRREQKGEEQRVG